MEREPHGAVTRRNFLAVTTAAVGACGLGFAAVPFIKAMSPTRDIIASGLMEVDISGIKEGEFRVIMWRKQPVFILKRTPEMIAGTDRLDAASLRDPATTAERVKRPDLLVCIGICTHLGCIPSWQPEKVPGFDQPGFYCPCHGGKYDTLGRRLAGPPPENLHLVPYAFEGTGKLRIGTARFSGYGEDIRTIQELPTA
ncbi:MAG: ubiquinol-cytochrome c reductase iron-sulfur subunit [Syntrophales bacterium]